VSFLLRGRSDAEGGIIFAATDETVEARLLLRLCWGKSDAGGAGGGGEEV
jgi:hypothetical protein